MLGLSSSQFDPTGHSAAGRPRLVRPGRPQSVGALMLEVIVRVRTMLGKRSDIRWQNLIRHLDGNCYGFLTVFICAYLRVALSKIRVDPASRTTTMRSGLICLTFAISIIPVVANAQLTIDMGNITCGQYLAMPPSQSDNFSAWMSGWFSYQSHKTYVDLVAHQKNIANVKEWCKYHPSESVMTGLQKAVVIN
jgi:HdeA/HdeB family protein